MKGTRTLAKANTILAWLVDLVGFRTCATVQLVTVALVPHFAPGMNPIYTIKHFL